MAAASPARLPEKAPVTPPRSPADIPGLGPIRVRALHKAGLDSLPALRAASRERLEAVPGMSAVKAAQIHDYLARFPDAHFAAIETRTPARDTVGEAGPDENDNATRVSESDPDASLYIPPAPTFVPPASVSPVQAESELAASEAVRLLCSAPAAEYRISLLRELARFLHATTRLQARREPLAERDRERALKRLRRARVELREATGQPDLDRKAQARFADSLTEVNDRLLALGGDAAGRKNRSHADADEEADA